MKIENLTKKFGKQVIFDNFSIDFPNGKVSCIVGESGVGKTTLLNCIAGLTEFGGKIERAENVAYAFQDCRLIPFMTVKENLKYVADKSDKEIEEALKKCDLFEKINSVCEKLSGGEKQRVNFVRAMLVDAEVYLLDEPFSSVDGNLKYKMIEEFLKEKEGKTVIYVTHDLFEATFVADEIFTLNGKGFIRYENSTDKSKRKPFDEESAKFISRIFGV